MGLTRAQIIGQVRHNIGRSDNDTQLTYDMKNVWLPLILRRIANEKRWPELMYRYSIEPPETLLAVAGYSYTLPTDVLQLHQVGLIDGDGIGNNEDGFIVPMIPPTEFRRRYFSTIHVSATQTKPTACSRFGRTLYFNCPADQVYYGYLYYLRRITDMSADGSECEIPDIDDILIAELTARGFQELKLHEQAAWWKNEAKQLLGEHDSRLGGNQPVARPYILTTGAPLGDDRFWE